MQSRIAWPASSPRSRIETDAQVSQQDAGFVSVADLARPLHNTVPSGAETPRLVYAMSPRES
jgi:hypothetical protein